MTAAGTEKTVRPVYLHDGEWAQVGMLMVYPRDDGTYSIGRPVAVANTEGPCWRDLEEQTGFANMQAAIDQAAWLAETPDMLARVSK